MTNTEAKVPPTATQMDDFPDTFMNEEVERAADDAMWSAIEEDFEVAPEVQELLEDEVEFERYMDSL